MSLPGSSTEVAPSDDWLSYLDSVWFTGEQSAYLPPTEGAVWGYTPAKLLRSWRSGKRRSLKPRMKPRIM